MTTATSFSYALVTGASGAIGRAVSRVLASLGHHVYVHSNRNLAAAKQMVGELVSAGLRASGVQFDVTDRPSTESSLNALLEIAPIQILVNSAGVHDDAIFPGMSSQQWHSVIDVSLSGFFNVTQPLILPMARTGFGRIISISSVAALAGNPGQVNYAAAKAAIHGASKSLALELASRGITVNVVAPGIIASPMSAAAFSPEAIAKLVPMKRAGTPEEVASLIAYLASKEAAYLSGQVISVNGAMY